MAQQASLESDGVPWIVGPWIAGALLQLGLLLCFLRSDRPPLLLALGFALAFRLICLPVARITNDDVCRYFWDGRVTAAGEDPYAFAPEQVRAHINGQPAAPGVDTEALGRLAGLVYDEQSDAAFASATDNLADVNYPSVRTVYPPLAQLAFALSHRIAPESLVAWKSLLLLAELLTVAALLLALRARGRPEWWVLLYAWSPLPIKEFALTGHVDVLCVAAVSVALWALLTERRLGAGVALGAAAMTKLWPLALIAVSVRKLGALGLVGATMAIALCVAPFVQSIDGGMPAFGRAWEANSGAFAVLGAVLGDRAARGLVAVATLVAAGVLYWRDDEQFERAWLALIALILLLSPIANPWYLSWLLPPLVLVPCWPLQLWVATVAVYYWSWRIGDPHWLYVVEYLPVYLALGWWWRKR